MAHLVFHSLPTTMSKTLKRLINKILGKYLSKSRYTCASELGKKLINLFISFVPIIRATDKSEWTEVFVSVQEKAHVDNAIQNIHPHLMQKTDIHIQP